MHLGSVCPPSGRTDDDRLPPNKPLKLMAAGYEVRVGPRSTRIVA